MLAEVHIQNLGLIDDLVLRFEPGLNVITGETGAGKSLIVEAINLITGSKSDSSLLKRGADAAEASGVFAGEREEIVVRRCIRSDGRSRSYLDGRPIALRELSGLGRSLIEIHGQHGHQALLLPRVQMEIIDRFGGEGVSGALADYKGVRKAYLKASSMLEGVRGDIAENKEKKKFLKWRVRELEQARLKAGEDRELEERMARIRNVDEVRRRMSAAHEALSGRAVDEVQSAVGNLAGAGAEDTEISPILEKLRSAAAFIEEAGEFSREYTERLAADLDSADQLQERLFLIKDLIKKYEMPLEGLLERLDADRRELEDLEAGGASEEELEAEVKALRSELDQAACRLNRARTRAAGRFGAAVLKQLEELAFGRVVFVVGIDAGEGDAGAENGNDRAEFLFSANAGQPPKPLSQIASGGELSRVMLAIRSVFGEIDSTPTLLFDEIDAGVGGKTAVKVGEKLAKLAKTRQIICVTHLAAIAAFAHNHLAVTKSESAGGVKITAKNVEGDERLNEISRLGGAIEESIVSVEHARQLIEQAAESAN